MKYKNLFHDIPGKGKFHSCILTTYSFDFHYMEEKVRRQLQAKGIINISVLVDEQMMQNSLGNLTGHLRHLGKSYSLSPMVNSSLFHPKINLFVGEESALILIGSGNLTVTGHGKNHEVWSAIYIENTNDLKLSFFYEVFNYLEQFYENAAPIIKKQKEWIKANSKLFPQKVENSNEWHLDEAFQYKFIANETNGNSYKKILQSIPSTEIEQINIVAPYFDAKGLMLRSLMNDFPKAKIKVLIQPDNCLPPIEMPPNERIDFYLWEENLKEDFFKESIYKRQHAKLFQFVSPKEEYLLLGSCNASIAAFGAEDIKSKNEEAGLLLKRDKGNWLAELGIIFKSDPIDLYKEDYPLLDKQELGADEHLWAYKILSVEKTGQSLVIQLDKAVDKNIVICFFNGWSELTFETTDFSTHDNKLKVTIESETHFAQSQFVQLFQQGQCVSNKGLILSTNSIYKTHPSKENRDIQKLIGQLEMSGNNTLDLVDYFFTIQKVKEEKDKKSTQNAVSKATTDKESMEVTFISMTYEEYNEQYGHESGDAIILEQFRNFNAVKILETIFKRIEIQKERESNQAIDEEELDDVDKSSGRTEEEKTENNHIVVSTKAVANKAKGRLCDFFGKYRKVLTDKIHDRKSLKPTIIDLAMYLISLYLLLDSYRKEITFQGEDGPLKTILLKAKGDELKANNFRIIAYDIIGLFTLLIQQKGGFANVKDDYISKKMLLYQNKALSYSLLCCYLLRINQQRSSEFTKLTFPLFCNIMDALSLERQTLKEQQSELEDLIQQFDLPDFNQTDFFKFVFKCERFYNQFKQKPPSPTKGAFYYYPFFGWTHIKALHPKNLDFIYLQRAGFYYIMETGLVPFETGRYFDLFSGKFFSRSDFDRLMENVFRGDFLGLIPIIFFIKIFISHF